jgi:hypothetical protein
VTDIPSSCQTQADKLNSLKAAYNEVAGQANATSGQPVWPLLARLADLESQISSAAEELKACISFVESGSTGTFDSVPTTGEVVVIDATQSYAFGPLTATAWKLTDTGLVKQEQCAVSNGSFSLSKSLPAKHAISIAEVKHASPIAEVSGTEREDVFFRSGLVEDAVSTVHLEAVIGPRIRISANELDRWLASALPIDIPLQSGAVDGALRLTALSSALEANDVLGVAVRGALSGTAYGVPLAGNELSGVLRCRPAPDNGADARYLLSIGSAPGGSDIHLSGSFLAMLADVLVSVAMPLLEGTIIGQVRSWLDSAVQAAVYRSLHLSEPPVGCTVTLRSCHVDPTGLSMEPAIGAVGPALSSYDPPPVLTL